MYTDSVSVISSRGIDLGRVNKYVLFGVSGDSSLLNRDKSAYRAVVAERLSFLVTGLFNSFVAYKRVRGLRNYCRLF